MKRTICLSLVLYGNDYIEKFFDFTFKTILKNLNKVSKKNFTFKFMISTNKNSMNIIKKKIESKTSIEKEFFLINEKKDKYKLITNEQIKHLKTAKKNGFAYLFFTYSDILFSSDTFLNSLKSLKNENIGVICSFALLLNQKHRLFKKIFLSVLKNKNHLKFLTLNNSLIDEYHKTFEENYLNFNRSFSYIIKNNQINIRSFHYHPVAVNLSKIKEKFNNLNIVTLDNGFLDYFFKFEEIYVEQNLKKISIFSFDKLSRINFRTFFNIKLTQINKFKLNRILFYISLLDKSEIERKLYFNNLLFYYPFKKFKNIDRKKLKYKLGLRSYKINEVKLQIKILFYKINKLNFKNYFYKLHYSFFFFMYIILYFVISLLSSNKFYLNLYLKIRGLFFKKRKIQIYKIYQIDALVKCRLLYHILYGK